jgi:small ligand-binding sensory domain FIST
VLMLADLPREQFRVFSGVAPLSGFDAFAAQVHADGATPDLQELIDELAQRTESGYLFGGLASSRSRTVALADGVFSGGLCGVAFTREVALLSRVTQGCQPIGAARTVTRGERNLVLALDGAPALDMLLRDLGVGEDQPRVLLPRLRSTLVGLTDAQDELGHRAGQFGADTRVRHLVGIDPGARAVAVADAVEPGMRLAFCRRDVNAARRDLVRICTEIREELEAHAPALAIGPASPAPSAAARIRGAIYVSCAGRGGPHFGAPSAELAIVRQALGDVPLAGFFAGGEIARHHLYGYTGVLTVFGGA